MNILQDYSFSPSDYAVMRFNVNSLVSTKKVIDQFTDLNRLKSFRNLYQREEIEADLVIKYICLNYDPASPVKKNISDEFRRKSFCGAYAGFPYNPETGIFPPSYHKVMNCEETYITDCITDFLFLFPSPLYALIESGYEALYKKVRLMNKDVIDDKKNELDLEKLRGQIFKDSLALADSLNSMTKDYLGEKNPYLKEALYRTMRESVVNKLNLTPEARAREKGLMS